MKKLFLLAALLIFFRPSLKGEEVKVKTFTVKKSSNEKTLEYSGTFFPLKEAVLGAANAGQIEKIHVQEGEKASKGQLIVQLTDEMMIQQKIDYEIKKKDFERVKRLREKESVSQQRYEHVEGMYQASRERYELLRKNTRVTAPFSGRVVEHLMSEGETYLMINPALEAGYSHSNGIVRLMDLQSLILKIDVNEREYPQIKKDTEVEIRTLAYPNEKRKGRVRFISPFLSSATHSARVEILVPNKDEKIKPGMFGKALIFAKGAEGLQVPRESVITDDLNKKHYVFKIHEGRALKTEIKVLEAKNDFLIVEGLQTGDLIVTAGKSKIKDQTLVEIVGGRS